MDTVDRSVLRSLAEVYHFPAISIYLPTHRHGLDAFRNVVRFRNALREGERQLVEKGLAAEQATLTLAVAQRLLDDLAFWKEPGDGLAVFLAGERQWVFRVPVSFEESVHVGDEFQLAPLASTTTAAEGFLVLALSENQAKLFAVDGQGIRPVAAPNLPANMNEALHYDTPEGQSHVLSQARYANRKEGSVFHGQGGATEHERVDLLAYCRMVGKALSAMHSHDVPLILATTERLAAIFRETNSIPNLLDEQIGGSPDHWAEGELLERAQAVIHAHAARRDQEQVARFRNPSRAELAADEPSAVLQAAIRGQIHELLIAENGRLRGRFNRDTGELHLAPSQASDAEDLIEIAVRETLIHDGTVRSVKPELLAGTPMIAVFRYAIA